MNRFNIGDKVDVLLDNQYYYCEVLEVPKTGLTTYVVQLMGNSDVTFHATEYEMMAHAEFRIPSKILCDCGAERVGHPGHSHWCSIVDLNRAIEELNGLSY